MDEPIKIERNALDVFEAIVSLASIIGVAAYLILAWNTIPDRIPMHYNAAGEINRWGDKSGLIVLPIISVILYGMITLIERFPQIWNTGVRVTDENRTQVYRLLKNLIACVKMMVLLVFGGLTVLSSLSLNLPIWFLLVFVVLLFGTIAFFIVKLTRLRSKYPLE